MHAGLRRVGYLLIMHAKKPAKTVDCEESTYGMETTRKGCTPSGNVLAHSGGVIRYWGGFYMKRMVGMNPWQLGGMVAFTLVVAGIMVPNLIWSGSLGSVDTMRFAGIAVTYKLQNVLFAGLGVAAGMVMALFVAAANPIRK